MLMAPGRIVYPVPDLQIAKAWYSDLLEVAPILDAPFAVAFRIGGTSLVLAPRPDATQRIEGSGLVYWNVLDPEAAHARLIEAGAKPHSDMRTIQGSTFASVIDPFGNILGIMGELAAPEKRGVDRVPSESAQSVALLRALAVLDEREEIRGKDILAECFLDEDKKNILSDEKLRRWVLAEGVPRGFYEYLTARTAYFDSVVQEALSDQIPQIVFLGAGYDSRPYRFQSLNQGTSIFELDSPPTQRRKLELLQKHRIEIPGRVKHIPIDFRADVLSEVLMKNGFDPGHRSLFIWEGVMYYLPLDAIDAVFECVHSNSAPGSHISFDYVTTEPRTGDPRAESHRASIRQGHPGEPIRTRIDSDRLVPFLKERGFELVDHVTAAQMEKAFLTLQDGSLIGKVPPVFGLASAAVR